MTPEPENVGGGATLRHSIPWDEATVIPAPSAFALACARMGWAADDVEFVTLHGRPIELIGAVLRPDAKIIALSHTSETVRSVADYLGARGYGESEIIALCNMGGPNETRMSGTAARWPGVDSDFHTLAITCIAAPGAALLPPIPGLPDDAFEHDGKMTKREVRAATLAKLMPMNGGLLWDVGAGSGSIGIEWLRADRRRAQAIAIEPIASRVETIARNAAALGAPQIDIRQAKAPDIFDDLPDPGGGLSSKDVFAPAGARLKPGGRLVANAVTLESEAVLLSLWQENGGDLVRIAVNRAEPVGPYHGWRPLMPVTQWALVKS